MIGNKTRYVKQKKSALFELLLFSAKFTTKMQQQYFVAQKGQSWLTSLVVTMKFLFSQKEISCEQFKMCSRVFAHIFEWRSHEKIFENTQEHILNCSKLISFWITKIEWFNKMSAKIEVSMQQDILLHFAPANSSCPYVISMIIFQPLL